MTSRPALPKRVHFQSWPPIWGRLCPWYRCLRWSACKEEGFIWIHVSRASSPRLWDFRWGSREQYSSRPQLRILASKPRVSPKDSLQGFKTHLNHNDLWFFPRLHLLRDPSREQVFIVGVCLGLRSSWPVNVLLENVILVNIYPAVYQAI